jgi:L,D-peptidoglycan transpeptidase YkuD (ErfK/YbiS/YcfS/YnhG family)
MRKRYKIWFGIAVFSLFLISCTPIVRMPETSFIPLQAMVVRTPDWNALSASLQRYERKCGDAPWHAVGEKIPAVVGRNGMGWGTGVHPQSFSEGPVKREGDGKAPAGVFLLRQAFGYPSAAEAPWIKLPYRQAMSHIQCVDDAGSPYYNRVVDTTKVERNWQSCEDMRRKDDQYRFGAVVEHNMDPVIPGDGSCIFLHIWEGPLTGTSGCTAVEAHHIEELLRWLDPDAMPVLVQMPEPEYVRFRSTWRLP